MIGRKLKAVCEVVPVEELEGSERGSDGYGSTGVRRGGSARTTAGRTRPS